MTPELPDFTDEQVQALCLVAARARIDRGDIAPMIRFVAGEPKVIDWLAALNMEVPHLG